MTVKHYMDVPAEPAAEALGVAIRWLIAQSSGADNFAMRVIEVQPGAATPFHTHPFEHETYVLEGVGGLRTGDSETPLRVGSFAFVPPDIKHQFVNRGEALLRFICVIPMPEEEH
jgi:quercetin dioxygenase-like cupin family protein